MSSVCLCSLAHGARYLSFSQQICPVNINLMKLDFENFQFKTFKIKFKFFSTVEKSSNKNYEILCLHMFMCVLGRGMCPWIVSWVYKVCM